MCHKCILKTNNKQGYKKVFWLYNTRDNKWIIDTRHINQSARPIPKVHRCAKTEMDCDLVLACCKMLYFFGKKPSYIQKSRSQLAAAFLCGTLLNCRLNRLSTSLHSPHNQTKPLNCGFFIWHITLYSVLTTRT